MQSNSDIQIYFFGNGRQTINPALGDHVRVKSGIQAIPGMIEDKVYTGVLVEHEGKSHVRFRTKKGKFVFIPIIKLYLVEQIYETVLA